MAFFGSTSPSSLWTALQNIGTNLSQLVQAVKAGPSAPPVYAFAALPAASANPWKVVACSNALKPGQSTGNGTGMLLFSDGVNWISTAGTVAAS